MQPLTPDTKIEDLSRVGQTTASRLKRLGLTTVKDLIAYLPARYDDLTEVIPVAELLPDTTATCQGVIELINARRSPRQRRLLTEAIVSDDSGSIHVLWFNQRFLTKIFKPGDQVYISGKTKKVPSEHMFINPVIEKVKKDTLHTARIVPIYGSTESVTQKQLRFLIKQALNAAPQMTDWMPKEIIQKRALAPLLWSFRQIHFPDNNQNLQRAIERIKFNELFLLQLKIALSKKEFSESRAPQIPFSKSTTDQFLKGLPFELTDDQKKVAWQVIQDISKSHPANRLIEGEVGSGKTVVVALVFMNVFEKDLQSVFMAPTEILAQQHYTSLRTFFGSIPIHIALLTRTESRLDGKKISRKKLLAHIADGSVDVIVGTHSLIVGRGVNAQSAEKVQFKNLGLVVVDEQHRFGVEQRKVLKEQSGSDKISPHFLSMTATPIPRTLSLIFYGDLKVSKIEQMPKGRKKIITEIIEGSQKQRVYDFIKEQVGQGRQAFVICPLIDPSDSLGVRSVAEEYERMKDEIFPNLNIDFLHGRLKSADKEEKMKRFGENKTNILISTSVVEVGVDVPNATVMIIEGAHRFGLAQLHQFRGRVGRGQHQAYCYLFTEKISPQSKKRLEAFVRAKNCFELAELDLELRGPGEMFGSSQSGFSDLKIATLQDWQLAQQARQEAEAILFQKTINSHPLLAQKIKNELTLAHFE